MIETLLVERYQLVKPLGAGGFAKTYLAEDRQQKNARCVIKHLTPANRSPDFLATARRLFEAEATALARLGTHDRIPALIDAFEVDGEFYLVQAYVDGEPLDELFERQVCSEADILQLLEEVLPILAFIHQHKVIHRDIKPSNLMRRHADGKLVLIDFGAVKEITTQLYTTHSDQFTVSIGTQGYAPPEQLAGRPRYSSDLYALGMTAIRGLTGRSPTELPENPQTGELLWQPEAPPVSPGLAAFLQRLTQISIYQRYPAAEVALQDLANLEALAQPPPSKSDMVDTALSADGAEIWPPPRRPFWIGSAVASLIMTAIVLLIQQMGGWMPLELLIYDEWVQRQPDQGRDDRLLLVEITEADLKALQQTTPSDAVLHDAIETLQAYEPRVIGLDLYRDIAQGDGRAELLESLAADNLIAIRRLGGRASEAIPAPPTVTPERVGFNDFPVDPDGVIRRNLLFASVDNRPDGEVLYSFSLRLVLAYLEAENILPLKSEENPDYLELDGTVFRPLGEHFGGYRTIDDAGYQMLLQYRSQNNVVQSLSLQELRAGQFTAAMIRDRIVVIGTTAPSAKDFFYTPFSEASEVDHLMPGVTLHVQATSQMLSSVLDGQRLPWTFPETVEILWALWWAAGGGVLAWYIRRPWLLGMGIVAGGCLLVAVPAMVFQAAGWLPVLPASLCFVGSAIATILGRSYWPTPPRRDAIALPASPPADSFKK